MFIIQLFRKIDMNGNGSIDWKEVDSFDVRDFLQQHDIIFNDTEGLSMKEVDNAETVDDNDDTEYIADSTNDATILKSTVNDEL